MMIIVVIIAVLAAAVAALALFRTMKLRKDVMNLRAVVDNQENYTFLVDEHFDVKESNVKLDGTQPRRLGNVLHCKNSHDTGKCGEGAECKHCPVRFVIGKSFERRDDFKDLEACMELGEGSSVQDVDVRVDGCFVSLDEKPHMVVNVTDVTSHGGGLRPKVLFVSKNSALFDQVRTALGVSFRVLSADTEHQAMHRLMHAEDYNFCAVITDVEVYHQTDSVVATILTERRNQMPVFVFAGKDDSRADQNVTYIDESIASSDLLKMVAHVVGKQMV